jgi:hypothetical protein
MQGGRTTAVKNESETSVPFVNERGEGKRRGTTMYFASSKDN